MREAVIASSVRTAVGKAFKGTLHATRPDDLAAIAIRAAIRPRPGLDPKEIEDVVLGCAMPEGEQGMNVARIASLARRTARGMLGHDRQSLLLLGPAGHRHGRGARHAGQRRSRSSPAARNP